MGCKLAPPSLLVLSWQRIEWSLQVEEFIYLGVLLRLVQLQWYRCRTCLLWWRESPSWFIGRSMFTPSPIVTYSGKWPRILLDCGYKWRKWVSTEGWPGSLQLANYISAPDLRRNLHHNQNPILALRHNLLSNLMCPSRELWLRIGSTHSTKHLGCVECCRVGIKGVFCYYTS